jgi:hypothetical protein
MRSASLLALALVVLEASAADPARIVKPCAEKLSSTGVVKHECAAAALAEQSFRTRFGSQVPVFIILAMHHTTDNWVFLVSAGNEQRPPAPGEDWMVLVNRNTREVEVTRSE